MQAEEGFCPHITRSIPTSSAAAAHDASNQAACGFIDLLTLCLYLTSVSSPLLFACAHVRSAATGEGDDAQSPLPPAVEVSQVACAIGYIRPSSS